MSKVISIEKLKDILFYKEKGESNKTIYSQIAKNCFTKCRTALQKCTMKLAKSKAKLIIVEANL